MFLTTTHITWCILSARPAVMIYDLCEMIYTLSTFNYQIFFISRLSSGIVLGVYTNESFSVTFIIKTYPEPLYLAIGYPRSNLSLFIVTSPSWIIQFLIEQKGQIYEQVCFISEENHKTTQIQVSFSQITLQVSHNLVIINSADKFNSCKTGP